MFLIMFYLLFCSCRNITLVLLMKLSQYDNKSMWAFAITWHPSSVICRPLTFCILIFSEICPLWHFTNKNHPVWWFVSHFIQWNLSIVVTWGRLTKGPLYTGDFYMKTWHPSSVICRPLTFCILIFSEICPLWHFTNKNVKLNDCCLNCELHKHTMKPVYSGHLGEIDKMTTIYRWLLYEGFWFFDKIVHASCK
jgi:hypothetical protein